VNSELLREKKMTTVELAPPAKQMVTVEEATFDPKCGYHVFMHEGVPYLPDATAKFIETMLAFPLGDQDVITAGYSKSGTNWLTITLSRLYPAYWQSTKVSGTGRVPQLCIQSRPAIKMEGLTECLASKSPRLLKNLAPVQHMPRAFLEKGMGKVIYITRNPKDVCESYFNQLKPWFRPDWNWDKHLEAFINGNVFYGSWLKHVVGWHSRGVDQGVLHIGYEDMKKDPARVLKRIVDFVGRPVEPGAIARVLDETSFRTMQENPEMRALYQPNMQRREGVAGGWKKRFTVAQSEAIDQAFGPTLKSAGIRVDYGE
jgi:Sulfotransferase domain